MYSGVQRSPGRSLFEPPVRLRCPPALRFSAFPHPGAPLSLSRSSQDLHFAGLRASSSPYHSARVAATRVLVGMVCLTPTGAFSGMLSATSAVLCDESRWRWDWYCDDQRLTLRRSVGPHLLALPLSPAPNPPQPASH